MRKEQNSLENHGLLENANMMFHDLHFEAPQPQKRLLANSTRKPRSDKYLKRKKRSLEIQSIDAQAYVLS